MSQKRQILWHLKQRGSIEPLQALNLYGCFRLAARIEELRTEGHQITTEKADAGHAIYKLVRAGQGELFN